MMIRTRLIALGLVAFLVWPLVSQAVILETKATGRRLIGYLVSWDKEAGRVTVRIVLSKGKEREQEFNTKDYHVILSVKPERLAELQRDKPHLYREYAEELEGKKDDPEARDMAMRLYLIAAYLDPVKLGPSCLKSMSNLARSPAEARRFLAMAYLLDPKHDRAMLKMPKAVVASRGSGDTAQKNLLLALHYFRRGILNRALEKARIKGVEEKFKTVPGLMPYKSFLAACKDKKAWEATMTPAQRAIIVRLELSKLVESDRKPDEADVGWSQELTNQPSSPIHTLKLETLTEHNPKRCLFRDGKWVEP